MILGWCRICNTAPKKELSHYKSFSSKQFCYFVFDNETDYSVFINDSFYKFFANEEPKGI